MNNNNDLISRADAIEAVGKYKEEHGYAYYDCACDIENDLKQLPSASAEADMSEYADRLWEIAYERGKRESSAEAKPILIKGKTLLPTKDFKEWAKRIKEVNPNAVVLPCDAEVVSAEAVQGEWTYLSGSKGSYMTISCPFCGTTFNDVAEWEYNYCPSCGARMYKGGDVDEID